MSPEAVERGGEEWALESVISGPESHALPLGVAV